MFIDPELKDFFAENDLFETVFAIDGEVFRNVKNRKTMRFVFNGRNYFVKIHRGVGWKEIIKCLSMGKKPVLGAENEYEAIRLLVPYEAILMDGALDLTFSGSNKNLLYTKRTLGKRSLLLIGNYGSSREGVTTLRIRGKVLNCVSGKTSTAGGSYKLVVPPDDFALLLVTE